MKRRAPIRTEARAEIRKVANRHRELAPTRVLRINQAVFMVRQRQLVPESLLEAAGFNGRRKK